MELELISGQYTIDTADHPVLWDLTGSLFRVKAGQVKLHVRPTGGARFGFGVEIKSEPSIVSGTHFGVECTVDHKPDTATSALGVRGLGGIARLKSGYTMTGGSIAGSYGQIQNGGTINGAGFIGAGVYALIEAGGTWTAVSHLAGLWVDSHLAAAPSAGSLDMVYITNNAAAQFANAFYIYAGNKITNLFTIDTASGMVGDKASGDYTFSNTRKIKVVAGGETGYIVMDIAS